MKVLNYLKSIFTTEIQINRMHLRRIGFHGRKELLNSREGRWKSLLTRNQTSYIKHSILGLVIKRSTLIVLKKKKKKKLGPT